MSKVLDTLNTKQQEMINQRSQLKDQLESVEKQLQSVSFALKVQAEIMKEEEAEALEAAEKMAAELAESATPSNN